MAGLSDSKFVMTWRTVTDLQQAQAGVAKTANWPEIGRNSYSVVYDAGNMIVGYWVQPKLTEHMLAKPTNLAASLQLGARGCGQMSLSRLALVSNPASEHVLSAPAPALMSFAKGGEAALAALGDNAENLSVVDHDGNFVSVLRAAPVGGAPAAAHAAAAHANAFVGFNLMVSNLAASRKFYGDVLGLHAGAASKTSASFTSGKITITLRQETAVGLVRSLRGSGRLNSDWRMFAVRDIDAAAKELEGRGVKFPVGIEDSPHGRGAYFEDPDGHVLNLWQPPEKAEEINYLPVLKRLMA